MATVGLPDLAQPANTQYSVFMQERRSVIWLSVVAGMVAAAAAAAVALATMLAMDRYVGTMLVPIGMAAGLAARWTGRGGARWFALGHTVFGIAAVWCLLPGLVQGLAQGKMHFASSIALIPLGEFFSKHYFHGALDLLSPPLALVSAWFLAIPKKTPVPASPTPVSRMTPAAADQTEERR